MSEKKTYMGTGGKHVSSYGNVNYMGGGPNKVQEGLQTVFADHPNAVVVDGNDDWFAPISERPASFYNKYGIEILAFFHTGISGISKTGIVLTQDQFDKLQEAYREDHGINLKSRCRIHKRQT